jgi:glycyl-tRNA synthetase
MPSNDKMEEIISLCKRRGFVFPGSEIYGGLANSWDYGPLGHLLKQNIKKAWWKFFVQEREDMVGIDAAIIMNPKVWVASGHLENFSDQLWNAKNAIIGSASTIYLKPKVLLRNTTRIKS